MERSENALLNSSTLGELQFDCLANILVQLLETAQKDLEHDQEAAKASLANASSILQSEIDRRSGAYASVTGRLAGWQIARVRAFIDRNLHTTIHIKDLSTVARRSAAYFARSFKHSFGEPPHAYVMRRRLEMACHLMMTSSETLTQIAGSVGFSDQSHLCKRFKQEFGQSPSNWRRERELFGTTSSNEPEKKEGSGHGRPEKNGSNVQHFRIVDRQETREKFNENGASSPLFHP
jgi:AraC family transcriptional regulator